VIGGFFSLSMPAAIFAAISPFPPFPAMAPAKPRLQNQTKTPTISGNPPKNTTGILLRNRGEEQRSADSGWNWARGLRLGECAGGFERDEQAIARAVLAGFGVFVPRASVYTRRESMGLGSVDLPCGLLYWAINSGPIRPAHKTRSREAIITGLNKKARRVIASGGMACCQPEKLCCLDHTLLIPCCRDRALARMLSSPGVEAGPEFERSVIFHPGNLFLKNNLVSLGHIREDTVVLRCAPSPTKTCGMYSC
jgi:hypothetical protein